MISLRIFITILPFLLLSCNNDNTEPIKPIPQPVDTISNKYLALGDSYTIGQSVELEERFPNQLVDSLRNRGYQMTNAKIIARTGWRVQDLNWGIINENITDTFDLVSLCIGVNDQFRGGTAEDYKGEFLSMLNQAIGFVGGDVSKVFVLSIPDYGVTPFSANSNPQQIAQEIDQFNAVNFAITDSLNISYIDITPISRLAENDPTFLAFDDLHPSGKMYRMWVELMLDEVEAKLD